MAQTSGSGGGGTGRGVRPSKAPPRFTGGKPSINIRVPRVQVPDVGKAVGDFMSHVAPQDALFRTIGNKLNNPTGAPSGRVPSGAGVSSLFAAPPKKAAPAAAGQRKGGSTPIAASPYWDRSHYYVPNPGPIAAPGQRKGRATLIGRDPLTFTAPGQRKGPTPLDRAPRSGQRKAKVPVIRPVVTSRFDPLTPGDTADTTRRPLGTRRFRAK